MLKFFNSRSKVTIKAMCSKLMLPSERSWCKEHTPAKWRHMSYGKKVNVQSKCRSKVTVKVTWSKVMVLSERSCHKEQWNTHAKYESPISQGKKVISKPKVWQTDGPLNSIWFSLSTCQIWWRCTQQFSLYCVHKVISIYVQSDLDLWDKKSIGFIPSPWLTCLYVWARHTQWFSLYRVQKGYFHILCQLWPWSLISKTYHHNKQGTQRFSFYRVHKVKHEGHTTRLTDRQNHSSVTVSPPQSAARA